MHGTGYYNILQLFNVTEADLTAGVKKLSVIGGKLGGNGFEPTIKPERPRFLQDGCPRQYAYLLA